MREQARKEDMTHKGLVEVTKEYYVCLQRHAEPSTAIAAAHVVVVAKVVTVVIVAVVRVVVVVVG